jgi:hypothetical protein
MIFAKTWEKFKNEKQYQKVVETDVLKDSYLDIINQLTNQTITSLVKK